MAAGTNKKVVAKKVAEKKDAFLDVIARRVGRVAGSLVKAAETFTTPSEPNNAEPAPGKTKAGAARKTPTKPLPATLAKRRTRAAKAPKKRDPKNSKPSPASKRKPSTQITKRKPKKPAGL